MTEQADQPARPTDPNELAATIAHESTAEQPPSREEMRAAMRRLEDGLCTDVEALADLAVLRDWIESEDQRSESAASLGRRGGLKGGKARAESLPPERRSEIAKAAAQARWKSGNESPIAGQGLVKSSPGSSLAVLGDDLAQLLQSSPRPPVPWRRTPLSAMMPTAANPSPRAFAFIAVSSWFGRSTPASKALVGNGTRQHLCELAGDVRLQDGRRHGPMDRRVRCSGITL